MTLIIRDWGARNVTKGEKKIKERMMLKGSAEESNFGYKWNQMQRRSHPEWMNDVFEALCKKDKRTEGKSEIHQKKRLNMIDET